MKNLQINFCKCLKNEYPDEKAAEENEVDIRKAANDNDGIERYIRDNLKKDENFKKFFGKLRNLKNAVKKNIKNLKKQKRKG